MKHDSINKSSQRFLSDVIRKIISTESIDEAFRDILTDTLRCYSAGRVVVMSKIMMQNMLLPIIVFVLIMMTSQQKECMPI